MKLQTQSLLAEERAGKIAKSGKRELIGERRGKLLYRTETPDVLIQEFTGNPPGLSTAQPGRKRSRTKEVNALRNEISSYLFDYLEGFHIPTHFIGKVSDAEMLVRNVEPIPLVLKVHNVGREPMLRLGITTVPVLEFPIIEHYYQVADDKFWVNEFHAYALNIATPEEFKQINRLASKVNAVLRGLCDRRQLMCSHLQIEFGRYRGQILLIDELSPSTCNFLDLATQEGADRFRLDQDDAESALIALRHRLQVKA
jgi:phosphoribosylaminoimidazole-succinocarboxamide synthase